MTRETRTTKTGISARHTEDCFLSGPVDRDDLAPERWQKLCTCKPKFRAEVYDSVTRKKYRTPFRDGIRAASADRRDLIARLATGNAPTGARGPTFEEILDKFVIEAREGRALNRHGRIYTPRSLSDIELSVRRHAVPVIGPKKVGAVANADVQAIVDRMHGKSSSRVRSVVHGVGAVYSWARRRGLASYNPAHGVLLPANDARPRDRVATVSEAMELLEPLPLKDKLPLALAFFVSARRSELLWLLRSDVDLGGMLLHLASDAAARKSPAAERSNPLLAVLRPILVEAAAAPWAENELGLLIPGDHSPGPRRSGRMSTEAWQARCDKLWSARGLRRITLQEARHTFATWCDASGLTERIVSILMGHELARPMDGSPVTRGYQHLLPGEIELAREKLDVYIASQLSPKAVPSGRPRLRLVS